ncbi:MAG: hypothetical protein P4L43_08155 [Syntrophobacteraceae bacterium]|nr:hypothetical protein [Syntrophobacteraceae bacterium]
MEQNDFVGKASGAVVKGIKLAWAWKVAFVQKRVLGFKLRKAKKELDFRTSRLGMEFYALYRRGESEITKSMVILQQLKIVEEAEAQVLALQERIDAIDEAYRLKKNAIAAKTA